MDIIGARMTQIPTLRITSQVIKQDGDKIVVEVNGEGINGKKEFTKRQDAYQWMNQIMSLINLDRKDGLLEEVIG